MRRGGVDRAAWAGIVNAALDTIPRRNKAQFARDVGVDIKTVRRWLEQEVDVSEESVREVARVFDLNTTQLLIDVGFYSHDDLGVAVPSDLPAEDEESIRMIMASDLPEDVKSDLVGEIRRLQQQHVDERASFAQRLLAMARRVARPT